jgi:pimeloyl-ACP methyl ester carboxylesterase
MLLLVSGCNGDGRSMLNDTGTWARFADEAHLVLVGPTFKTTMEEVHSRHGYYYPELWSGEATLKALEQIRSQTGVQSDKVFVFGFSAGAHFAHRFALWRPDKVAAFVAYSAGWWDAPKATLRNTPGLIMCGEADERYEPTYAFFSQGRRLGLPLVWRSYTGVSHELKPQLVKMAQAFLGFYARGEKSKNFVGDIQAYRFYDPGSEDAQRVPPESRVVLPSRSVAEVWQEEQ